MARLALDTIHVATPCGVSWETMTGDDQVRFCHDCKRRVYNISEMTRQQAQDLLEQKEGRLCIRLYRRADGTLITQDCPVGVWKWFRRGVSRIAAIVMFLVCLSGYFQLSRNPNSSGNRFLREVEPFKTFASWLGPRQPVFQTVATSCFMGCPRNVQPAEPPPQPEDPAIGKQAGNEN